ncbi:hypothetical protein ACVWYG_000192 [Pedobacter sp. UYEF25]
MEANTNFTTIEEQFDRRLELAIDAGIDFLYEHQYPNGEFCSYLSPDDRMQEWCYPESNVFCTSVLASCLLGLREDLKVRKILESTSKFLRYQMMTGGLWNFFTKFNPLFKFTPPDVDTTVYTSALLSALSIDIPNNKLFLLANRAKSGLFFTWIVWRPGAKIKFSDFKVFGRELKRPVHSLTFWLKHEVNRNDVDAVVNANALFYFGLNDQTAHIVDYLLDVLRSANEESSDKWYKNLIVFYYFVSRNFPKVKELAPAKPLILSRLFTKINHNGSFGESDLEHGMALVTLLNLNFRGKELDSGIDTLLKSQSRNGYWKRSRLFYCGPSKATGWGSEETTTAFCLEALSMYRKQQQAHE